MWGRRETSENQQTENPDHHCEDPGYRCELVQTTRRLARRVDKAPRAQPRQYSHLVPAVVPPVRFGRLPALLIVIFQRFRWYIHK